MIDQLRLLLLALQFYTRVPVTGRVAHWARYEPQRLARATRYFPLVGLLVGVLMTLCYMIFAFVLPHSVAVLLAVIAGVLCTGAFHEDGWADFCDGFGAGRDRARTLAIMTDSRIGAFGAIGLVLLLVLKIEVLAHLDSNWTPVALLTAQPFSRACAVLVMLIMPYARSDDDAKAKPVAQNLRRIDGLIAIAIGIAPAAIAAWWFGAYEGYALAILPALIATVWLCRKFWRRLRGYTGDCLGATQQVAEVCFLLGLLAWATIAVSYADV